MIRNEHWLTQNGTRNYPLADQATAASTSGVLLPTDIILDLNLRYPETYGLFPFISGITVTATLVTVTFQCATALNAATFTPLGAVSIPRSQLTEGINYPVNGQLPGVGGWIIFGSGTRTPYAGRFTAAAGLLAPRAARTYRPLPVTDAGKLYADPALTGIVRLQATPPLQITGQSREILGIVRHCAVISLIENSNGSTSILSQFTGPCGNRPESGNCGDNLPFESLNGVPPDCKGNIVVQLGGCALLATVPGGVVIDCGLGLLDACVTDNLPTETGVLPNEYPDNCNPPQDLSEISIPSLGEPASEFSGTYPVEGSHASLGSFPYTVTFPPGTPEWTIVSGNWGVILEHESDEPFIGEGINLPSEISASMPRNVWTTGDAGAVGVNLSVWSGFDYTTLNRVYTADMRMLPGLPGARHNAAIVINYREDPLFGNRQTYYLAQIDYDIQQLNIMLFTGGALAPTSAYATIPGLALNTWYRMIVTVLPVVGDEMSITVELYNLEGPAVAATIGPWTTTRFLPDTGQVGFYTNRADSEFAFLEIAES